MIGRLVGAWAGRKLLGKVTAKYGGVAGMAAGAALASRRTRGAGLAGLAALAAFDYVRDRRAKKRAYRP